MTDKELREMGVEDAYVRKDILEALKKENAAGGELQKAYEEAVAELEAVKKQAAVEKAILEAGGKHVKAILALIDMEAVTYDEKKGLQGLDLDAVKEEVPYLFHEKEEKKKGTGITKSMQKKREDDIRAAFWGLK
jgi:hypothetical protein